MNKFVKIGFASLAIIFSLSSCSETTAQSADATQEVVKNSTMAMGIEGMTCAMGCARAIETELKNVDGVSNAVVDFESATASIEFNPSLVSEAGLLAFVNDYKDGSYKATTMLAQKNDKSKNPVVLLKPRPVLQIKLQQIKKKSLVLNQKQFSKKERKNFIA